MLPSAPTPSWEQHGEGHRPPVLCCLSQVWPCTLWVSLCWAVMGGAGTELRLIPAATAMAGASQQCQWALNRSWAGGDGVCRQSEESALLFSYLPWILKRGIFLLPWQTPFFTALIRSRKYLQELQITLGTSPLLLAECSKQLQDPLGQDY